jgi:hypothetical protein
MKILRFKGGLGNQLFQYGLLISLIENYDNDVYIDLSAFDLIPRYRGEFSLENSFHVHIKRLQASIKQIDFLSNKNYSRIDRLRLRITGYKKTHYLDRERGFDKNVYNDSPLYLDGYWQSFRYFKDYKNTIIANLVFKINIDDEFILDLARRIKLEKSSVSIHVRRGDYLNDNSIYVDLMNTSYYNDCLNQILDSDRKVFVFSDDINSLTNVALFEGFEFINTNGLPDHYDMYLMSLCKINIIANSTYSWWSAFLNRNTDIKIYCPSRWFAIRESYIKDLYPSDWNIIDVKF